MNRSKLLPLTETVYTILLTLTAPAHGYAILQRVHELSDGDIRMAAGTLYGALETLVKNKLIERVDSDDPRRKVYVISDYGREILREDTERMRRMISLADQAL